MNQNIWKAQTMSTTNKDWSEISFQFAMKLLLGWESKPLSIGDYRDKYQFASANKSRMQYEVSSKGLVDWFPIL